MFYNKVKDERRLLYLPVKQAVYSLEILVETLTEFDLFNWNNSVFNY